MFGRLCTFAELNPCIIMESQVLVQFPREDCGTLIQQFHAGVCLMNFFCWRIMTFKSSAGFVNVFSCVHLLFCTCLSCVESK